jgi:hypothetical protein
LFGLSTGLKKIGGGGAAIGFWITEPTDISCRSSRHSNCSDELRGRRRLGFGVGKVRERRDQSFDNENMTAPFGLFAGS